MDIKVNQVNQTAPAEQVQNTFDFVRSSAWISRPITGIYDDIFHYPPIN